MKKKLSQLLASNQAPQTEVSHFFYFPTEEKMQGCILKLTALGFKIEAAHNRDADKSKSIPIETEEEVEMRNKEFIKYHKMGLPPPKNPVRRSLRSWTLIASGVHSVEDGFEEIFLALEELAKTLNGQYDGYEYHLDEPPE